MPVLVCVMHSLTYAVSRSHVCLGIVLHCIHVCVQVYMPFWLPVLYVQCIRARGVLCCVFCICVYACVRVPCARAWWWCATTCVCIWPATSCICMRVRHRAWGCMLMHANSCVCMCVLTAASPPCLPACPSIMPECMAVRRYACMLGRVSPLAHVACMCIFLRHSRYVCRCLCV